MNEALNEKYREILISPIRECATYSPKFGHGRGKGLSLNDFQALYGADSFYKWLGLDNPLMYSAHKAAGGITSIYRQIGIGSERLVREILMDNLGLDEKGVKWSYQVPAPNGKVRTLSLDARIIFNDVTNKAAKSRLIDWKDQLCEQLNLAFPVRQAIWSVNDKVVADLLKVAFCREIIALSNAAFNHVSTSFGDSEDDSTFTFEDGKMSFASICEAIAESLKDQPVARTDVSLHNSMSVFANTFQPFDTLITSPPYPNRISYIRELRPYMYWLGYLNTPDDASNLDWNTIGGTWGSATSKLSTWKKQTNLLPDYLFNIADNISKAENRSAGLMANYVLKYFDDMAIHIQSVYNAIQPGGTVHYIVGNSNFYGNSVPSEKIYTDILSSVGFANAKYTVVRKRNCNKALFEYWISAKKV